MHRAALSPQLKRIRDGAVLTITDEAIAGRHSSCDISLVHEHGASRKHARFKLKDDVLSISDLGSLNGTLVNGKELEGTQILNDGDILIFDSDEYQLLMPIDSNASAPHATANNADTVIANKAERDDPSSIKSEIKIITSGSTASLIEATKTPAKQASLPDSQVNNTVEYLNAMPTPDMKRPVRMPDRQPTSKASGIIKRYALILAIVLTVVAAFYLGMQTTN